MKTIYIVRHAKSSWDSFDVRDHDRTLMNVGVKKTDKVINYLNSNRVLPDVIICSSAVRAYETAKLIATGIGFEIDSIIKNKALYHAGVDDIYTELFGVDNAINSAMIIAHNPTLTDFVNDFVSPPINNLPTTGMVCVEFETDKWENVSNAKFNVNFVVFPRMLS